MTCPTRPRFRMAPIAFAFAGLLGLAPAAAWAQTAEPADPYTLRLSDEQKKLLRQFESSLAQGGEKHSPKSESWTDKVKSFFS